MADYYFDKKARDKVGKQPKESISKGKEKELVENDGQKFRDIDIENNLIEYRPGAGDASSETIKEYRPETGTTGSPTIKEHRKK
ncbi:hypothetical protein R4Z10_19170 [Niallia sp. XMNu-256]|uniref:hypothetical protein n=1 Tax=Niallia sp. XMNu-256 TaxID=3082444 RepID=UPI0030CD4E4B